MPTPVMRALARVDQGFQKGKIKERKRMWVKQLWAWVLWIAKGVSRILRQKRQDGERIGCMKKKFHYSKLRRVRPQTGIRRSHAGFVRVRTSLDHAWISPCHGYSTSTIIMVQSTSTRTYTLTHLLTRTATGHTHDLIPAGVVQVADLLSNVNLQ